MIQEKKRVMFPRITKETIEQATSEYNEERKLQKLKENFYDTQPVLCDFMLERVRDPIVTGLVCAAVGIAMEMLRKQMEKGE